MILLKKRMILAALLALSCVTQAGALEYSIDAPEGYLFGRPTSEEVVYETEAVNVDRSKNTALIPPAFGTPPATCPAAANI